MISRADCSFLISAPLMPRVTIGDSTRIEGAAGSEYATIPVTVDAETSRGERQHFVGTYTLRRVMVDGAPAEDRRWHIESAHLSS